MFSTNPIMGTFELGPAKHGDARFFAWPGVDVPLGSCKTNDPVY